MSQHRILVVENNASFRNILQRRLESLGYQADAARNLAEAKRLTDEKTYHLALVDLSLGEEEANSEREDYANRDGHLVVRHIKAKGEGTRVVVLSGHPDTQVATDSLQRFGADYFLSKNQLCPAPTGAPASDPLPGLIKEQAAKAKLKWRDDYDTPVRCVAQGNGADIWLAQAVEAIKPTYGDKSLHQYLEIMLEALGPARRGKSADALLDVRVRDKAIEGVFWSKAKGCAAHVVLAYPRENLEDILSVRYGAVRPEPLFQLTEHFINGCAFPSPEPRENFVEP